MTNKTAIKQRTNMIKTRVSEYQKNTKELLERVTKLDATSITSHDIEQIIPTLIELQGKLARDETEIRVVEALTEDAADE